MKEMVVIGCLFLAVLGTIIWLGVRGDNAKTDGCREAGGSMIGEICIIRNDRSCPE